MVIVKRRSRTPSKYIYYALHLYFSGLSSLRKTSQHLSPFFIRRNHVSIWNWIQRQRPEKIFQRKRRSTVSEFIVDETIFKVGDEFVFLWVAIEPPLVDKVILLGIRISSFERSMLLLQSIFYVL